MFGAIFVFSLIVAVTVLVTKDAMSIPQIGAQFGDIHNNGTGGGNGANLITPYRDADNSSSSLPGAGYPEFYASHTNDSAPTSPSMNSSSFDVQNSNITNTGCDCSQANIVQDSPTNAPNESSSDAASAASSAASSSNSRK